MHRLDLALSSHPKKFFFFCLFFLEGGGGKGVRTHANSKGKIPSVRKILPRGGSNPQQRQAGQRAQHTTNELFRPFTSSDSCYYCLCCFPMMKQIHRSTHSPHQTQKSKTDLNQIHTDTPTHISLDKDKSKPVSKLTRAQFETHAWHRHQD